MWRGGSRIAVIVYSTHRWSRFKIKPEDVWPNRIFSHISINSLKIKRIKWEILDQLLLWRDWNSVLYVDLAKYKKVGIIFEAAGLLFLSWIDVSFLSGRPKRNTQGSLKRLAKKYDCKVLLPILFKQFVIHLQSCIPQGP